MISHNTSVVNHLVVNQGATPAEWAHFADALGLRADLLPVVSDLTVPLSATTALKKLDGKTPTAIQNGKAHGIAAWPTRTTTAAEIARWSADSRHGIGLIGRQIKAFDIDIDDEHVAGDVRKFLDLGLGAMPCRGRPGTGKKLLAFRLAEPVGKAVIKTAHGNIELLGDCQQFLLIGQHKTGTRYTWEDGLPAVIPTLTLEEVQIAWAALATEYGIEQASSSKGEYKMRPPVECSGQDPERDLVVQLWDVDHEDSQGRLHGQCPWWTEHTDADPEEVGGMFIPAAVKGQGHSGFKCLHSHCEKRTVFDFLQAVGVTSELIVDEFDRVLPQIGVNTDGTLVEVQPLPNFTRVSGGRIEASRNNVHAALCRTDICGTRIAFDKFVGKVMLAAPGTDGWRAVDDNDYTRIARGLEQGRIGFKHIPQDMIRAAIYDVADCQSFDSAQDWLTRLEWDGVERCERFLLDYLGVEDTPYNRAVALYVWTALAGRVLEPGIKADMVLVLVGAQGVGKSSTIRAMAPDSDYFYELDLGLSEAEAARAMRGRLVIELGELRGLRAKEISELKSWIAKQIDGWRELYKEHGTAYPRRSLFIGSTNEEAFLVDDTGSRRWLPVTVPPRSPEQVVQGVKAVERDCEQLWAEGAVAFKRAGIQWAAAELLAKKEHSKYEQQDPWLEPIENWLNEVAFEGTATRGASGVTVHDVLVSAVNVPVAQITPLARRRVTAVLRKLGFKDETVRMADGKRTSGFRKS